jgi:hypothetical protein
LVWMHQRFDSATAASSPGKRLSVWPSPMPRSTRSMPGP